MTIRLFVLAAVFAGATAASAQDVTPAYEVASVKRNTSGPAGGNVAVQPGGVNIVNIPLRAIVQLAYGIQQGGRVVGLLDWAVSDRYDIVARWSSAGPSSTRPDSAASTIST